MTEKNVTFADLYDYITKCDRNSYGFHTPKGTHNVKFHVYSNLRQVNINFTSETDSQGLSHCNIVFFDSVDNKPTSVKIYPCTKPGICNYGAGTEYPIDTEIDSDTSPMWYADTIDGVAVREILMDVLYPYVNGGN